MAEIGQVIKVSEDFVTIKLQRQDACGHCNACTAGVETDDMILEAQNLCQAEEGDLVEVHIEESNFLLAVIIMYIIPLTALLIGLFIGSLVGDAVGAYKELFALVIGLGLVVVSFLTIRANEPKFHTKKFRPIANHLVKKHEE